MPRIYILSISTGAVPVTKTGKKFLRLHKFGWIRPAIDLAMSGSSDLAVQDGTLVGYHCCVTDSFESQIALDNYPKAVAVLPSLAERKAEEVRDEVQGWLAGPRRTGEDFAGTWTTSFAWGRQGEETATDKLHVSQCGDFVSAETVAGSAQWAYTLSGTVQENVLIGEWKGATLRGSFLLIKSREHGNVSGYWVGTGDAEPYFGQWSWEREHE